MGRKPLEKIEQSNNSDIKGIYDVFNTKQKIFYNFNNNSVLSADFLLFLNILNNYLYNLNLIKYKFDANYLIADWNNKYTDMKIINIHTYEIFKESYFKLINNNLLNFITENRLVDNLFIDRGYITQFGKTLELKQDTPMTDIKKAINSKNLSKMYIVKSNLSISNIMRNLISLLEQYFRKILENFNIDDIFKNIFSNSKWKNDNYDTIIDKFDNNKLENYYSKETYGSYTDFGNINNWITLITDNTKDKLGFTNYGIITNDTIHSKIKRNPIDNTINTKNINETIYDKSYGITLNFNLFDNVNNSDKKNIYLGKGNRANQYDFIDDILDPICDSLALEYIRNIKKFITNNQVLTNIPYLCGTKTITKTVDNPQLNDKFEGIFWNYPKEILKSKILSTDEKQKINKYYEKIKLSMTSPFDPIQLKIEESLSYFTPIQDDEDKFGNYYKYAIL
jgi:hypothetical protein